MECNHKDKSTLHKFHLHQKQVPEGYNSFSVDWYLCSNCKNPVTASIIIPHPEAKPIRSYSEDELKLLMRGLKGIPADTVIDGAVQ